MNTQQFTRMWDRVAMQARGAGLLALGSVWFWSPSARANVFPDREYTLGDNTAEMAVIGGPVGAATSGTTYDSAGTPGVGDLQDLLVNGAPTYTNTTGRPFLGGSGVGISFNGATDYLTGIRFNSPNEVWASSAINQFAPPFFPNNYSGIFNRGFQLWVKPDSAKQGSATVQGIVLDTMEHGVYITDTDHWGFLFDDIGHDTGASVQFDTWTHVFHRTLNGTQGAALYINGVAVAAANDVYDNSTAPLVIGSNITLNGTFYQGQMDDLQMFLWGNNSTAAPGAQGQLGMNWGSMDLGVDNDWIAGKLSSLGVTNPADVNLDGAVNPTDIDALKLGWRSRNLVNGIQVGDWISRQAGDLNYDGIVNLADAYMLHQGLVAGGGAGINFPEFLSSVPEPSTWFLLALGGGVLAWAGRRRLRRASAGNQAQALSRSMLVVGIGLAWGAPAAAAEVFNANFDDPTVGSVGNPGALLIGSGTQNGVTTKPQRHEYLSGNWARLFSADKVQLQPTSSTELVGTTMSFDVWDTTSGTVGRVFHVAGMQGSKELFRVGFDLQQQLYVNGSSAANIVPEPNDAFKGLNWTKISITLNAMDWNLTVQQYAPPASTSASSIVTITDPVGMPSGPMDTYTFPYLNSATYVSQLLVNGSSGSSSTAPLEFFDNFKWSGTLSAFEGQPVVEINRATGAVSLRNNTPDPLNLLGYSLLSSKGALNAGSWTSIAGHYDDAGNGSVDADDDWFVLSAANARTDLSEFQPDGNGGTLASMQSVPLGNAWFRNPIEDVSVELLLADGTVTTADVKYVGNSGVPIKLGDIDFDGSLAISDWAALKTGFGGSGLSAPETYGLGDLNGDLVVDLADTIIFRNLYDAEYGAGAFARAVPEPGSWVLACLSVVLGLCLRPGVRKHRLCKMRDMTRRLRALRSCGPLAALLSAAAMVGLMAGQAARADNVFSANFDDPTVGGIGNSAALLIGSGTVNGTVNFPQRHEYLSGNWARLFSDSNVVLQPTSPTELVGTTMSFDFWNSNSGTAGRVFHYSGMQGSSELFRVGFDMGVNPNANLYVNGSLAPNIVIEPNDAFQTINWTKVSITLHATDWELTIQQYAPPAPTSATIVTITDPVGMPSGPMDTYTFPYLNAGTYVSEVLIDGSSGASSSAPLEFFDNFSWNGTPGPLPMLRVNTVSGAAAIANGSSTSIALNGYSISSASGALNAAGLTSLQNTAGYGNGNNTDGIGWEVLGTPGSGLIAEAALSGSNALTNGSGAVALGQIFDGPMKDLIFKVTDVYGALIQGSVEYGRPGDVNFDGLVNIFDVNLVSSNWNSAGPAGDANWDGIVDIFDINLISSNWAPSGAAAVPEPTAWLLYIMGLICLPVLAHLRRPQREAIQ